jgi:hypothetical protein
MKIIPRTAVLAVLALASASLLAGPAPWFEWRSKVDGKLVCSQTPLGHGWEKASGPYKDSHCGKLMVAK